MPNSLREVKMRISSTEHTAQITKAMYMVSQSKVKKAEKVYSSYQDFMKRITLIVSDTLSEAGEGTSHPLLEKREIKNTCYFLITSDRGLAGSYNSALFKQFENDIKDINKDNYYVAAIGKKGYSFINKRNYKLIQDNAILVRDDVMFIDIEKIAQTIIDLYLANKIDKVVVYYNHYINSLTQEISTKVILPIEKIEINENKNEVNYSYEAGIDKTLDLLLPMYVKDILYGIVLDAKTSEHTSRMNSMRNATDNANEVIEKLELLYNRARQSVITNELIDIIAGAAGVGGSD